MKHIDKYNKFIKLNEDIEINGDIDEHDLNIIKDGLIELGDLGWKIIKIDRYKNTYYITLSIETKKITSRIHYECGFDKNKFYDEDANTDYNSKLFKQELNDYDNNIINIAKERSQFLLNILNFNNGIIRFFDDFSNDFRISIILSKNKIK